MGYLPSPKSWKLTDGRIIIGFDKLPLETQQEHGYTPVLLPDPVAPTSEEIAKSKLFELDSNLNSFVDKRYNATLKVNIMAHAVDALSQGLAMPDVCRQFNEWKKAVETFLVQKQTEISQTQDPAAVDVSINLMETLFGDAGTNAADPKITTKDLI